MIAVWVFVGIGLVLLLWLQYDADKSLNAKIDKKLSTFSTTNQAKFIDVQINQDSVRASIRLVKEELKGLGELHDKLSEKVKLVEGKAVTAEFLAHSAKMDSGRPLKIEPITLLVRTKKRVEEPQKTSLSTDPQAIKKIKKQMKDVSV